MRVVCVIDDLGSGGAQRQLVNLARGLARRGHAVTFFTYHDDGHFRPELDEVGIPVRCVPKAHRFSLAPVGALRRVVREWRAEAVVAFLETPAVYAELACVGAGVRLLVGERNSVVGDTVGFVRRAKSRLHGLADLVVANSIAHRDWMARHFPYLDGCLHAIWNGIDLEQFAAAPLPAPTGDEVRLLGIGRIARAKNIPRLIRAVAAARAAGAAVRVDWVGRVDEPEEQANADQALRDTGLGDAWAWLGERRDIPRLLAEHDALVAPSLWEGLPNVVCEALACGRPVLASRVADNARLVEDGVRGVTFEATHETAITDALRHFARLSFDARATMGREARRFAERHLSIDRNVDAYEQLLAEPSRTP